MPIKWEIIESSIDRIVLRPLFDRDEFIPVIKFNRSAYSRPRCIKLVEQAEGVTLSDKIDENKRRINLYTFTTLPGLLILPLNVEKGFGTSDEDGIVEAVIEPPTADVQFTNGNTFKVKYGQQFQLPINITGHTDRSFSINFYANDDNDNNRGELNNIHCGKIDINVLGSSAVGFRLINNIDSLPNAPVGYDPPDWNTADPSKIKLSQEQANIYNNCEGVCYATSASRAQRAYIDITGSGVIDLTVSNKNVDHRIASTQGGYVPFMGYGAGGPFARHGYGQTVDNKEVWNGDLKRGALLQIWHSADAGNLFESGGHSVIFRNYLYDDNGIIDAIEYTDYHGGINGLTGKPFYRNVCEFSKTILGVNLLDTPL
ncbi:MAG: hypothetical protein GX639_20280 [Fibrobacter sp.]|nr:hypothetical protein [Fibrobacter sp.]